MDRGCSEPETRSAPQEITEATENDRRAVIGYRWSLFSHPRLTMGQEMGELLWEAGARLAFEAADAARRATVRKRKGGSTLRPGEATPLWQALVADGSSNPSARESRRRRAVISAVQRRLKSTNSGLTLSFGPFSVLSVLCGSILPALCSFVP
jgi:hypothetical protein